jgi:hypothetical protein
MMEIRCLFAQRKCSYDGQYAPELLAAIDEYGDTENPDYLNEAQEKADDDNDLLFSKRITVSVPDAKFDEVFFGKNQVDGMIEES